jgi:hypothetical protein
MVSPGIAGPAFGSDVVRFDFLAARSAEDIDGPIEYRGWGGLRCDDQAIYLLNLGQLDPSENTDWCPAPASETTEDVVVACARA